MAEKEEKERKIRVPKWREFLGLDKRSLALFRVSLGLIVFLDSLDRIKDAYDHYSDDGVLPREVVLKVHWNFYWVSLHMMNGSAIFQQFLFLIHAMFAFCMMIGYRTKLFTFLTWFMVTSHHARNNLVGHGGDMYMRLILFWAMFVPTSSYFSVDRAFLRIKRKAKRNLIVSGGTIAIIVQVCLVYVSSYFHKYGDEWHVEGTSTELALKLDYFRLPLGDFFLHFPLLMKYMSFAVLYYEGLGVALLFVPYFTQQWRTLGVFGFILMHIGFGACMGLGVFSPISSTTLAALLPPWFWDELVFKWLYSRTDRRVRILYYKNTPGEALSTVTTDFLLLPDTFTASNAETELGDTKFNWMAVERNGTTLTRFEAFCEICKLSPLLWPARVCLRFINGVPPIRTITEKMFTISSYIIGVWYYATHDNKIFPDWEVAPRKEPVRQVRKVRRLASTIFALFMMAYCFSWVAGNINVQPLSIPGDLHYIAFITRMDQMWNMFSPGPPRINWWYTIEGALDDGTKVELWLNGLQKWEAVHEPYSVAKPTNLGEVTGNHRWVKYYEFLNWGGNSEDIRLHFGRYVCREYNRRHWGRERLWQWNLVFHTEENQLDGKPPIPQKDVNFWSHYCYDKINNENIVSFGN